jgi:hypothetical protein
MAPSSKKTAWTFQLLSSGPFQVDVDVANMGPADVFVFRVKATRNDEGKVIDRQRDLVAKLTLADAGKTSVTLPPPPPDVTNDTYFSVLCAATKGAGASALWSWTLGVRQGNAKCPLSWGPTNNGGQCITTEGVRDPCEGGYTIDGDIDESVIVFDVLAPPSE